MQNRVPQQINLNDLPEYREAVEREFELRSQPFIDDWPEAICGIEVKQFTRNHLNKLQADKNAFVYGGEPTPEHAILFLWIISPEYDAALKWKSWISPFSDILAEGVFSFIRKKFRNKLKWTSHAKRVSGIWEYLQRAFFDSGGTSTEIKRASYFSGSAVQVGRFAKEFGWSAKETLNLPIRCEFQLVNWLDRQEDPKKILWNPLSDRARREGLERMMQEGAN